MAKTLNLILAAATLLTTGFQSKRATEPLRWIEFSPKDSGFSIMVPAQPTQRMFAHSTADEKATSPLYEVKQGDVKYVISYMTHHFSEAVNDRNHFLDMAAEAGITQAGGTLTSSRSIVLGGYPGREVEGRIQENIYRSRVYLVDQRVYLLIVLMPATATSSEAAAKFFKSFKIVYQ